MKRFFLLSALGFIYLLFSSKSCSNREEFEAAREQERLKNSIDSISSAFSSDTLSPVILRAFEETAKLRFADFLDYLTILTDTNAAQEFKVHARAMIREMFVSETCVFRFISSDKTMKKEITLIELLDPWFDFLKNLGVSPPDSVWIANALQPVNDSIFAGKLGFSFRLSDPAAEMKSYHLADGGIEFFAVKREKRFGKETMKAWEILIGKNDL